MPDLLELMREIARQANAAGLPADWTVGTVETDAPLTIRVDAKQVLPAALLTVPRALTEFELEVTPLDWQTSPQTCTASHVHAIPADRVRLRVHAALRPGEQVFLLRKPGGQHYLVLGRVVTA